MTEDRWTEIDELVLRRTTMGLSEVELERLNELLADAPDEDRDWIERLIGELDAEISAAGDETLPPELREALMRQAGAADAAVRGPRVDAGGSESIRSIADVAARRSGPSPVGRSPVSGLGWMGWAAAAVMAGFLLMPGAQTESDGVETAALPASPVERALAVADRPDAMSITWTATEDPTALGGVSGEVVWSDEAQNGFMRFSGLAANDPSEFQYQLWIFDAERDERFPVDGGVFDIPEGADEIVVPIDAQLPVGAATLFAVTVEQPGGVVVSDRSRIAVVAQAE